MTNAANTAASVKVLSLPSKSKGWGSYSLTDEAGTPAVRSRTGNEWISSSKELPAPPEGATLLLTLQCRLTEGRYRKQTTYTQTYELRAESGAQDVADFAPGSQGVKVALVGLRLVQS